MSPESIRVLRNRSRWISICFRRKGGKKKKEERKKKSCPRDRYLQWLAVETDYMRLNWL
jgi:hypothetical protein